MKRHRIMDLQPPPPPLFHHQHLRYEHVLLNHPNFIPQPTHNYFPPPPPQLRQPNIILRPPPLHIAHSPRFNISQHGSHPYGIDLLPNPRLNGLLPNPYLKCNLVPPPPPENINRQFHPSESRMYNGINDCGRGLNDARGYGEKGCDRVTKKMDYDESRRGSIDGWIRGLYMDKDTERDYDERRKGSGISEEQFVRSMKKRRLQKETALSRVQSGEDYCSRDKGGDEESSGDSFLRDREKEGFKCFHTSTDDKKECEAILESPCSDDVKTDINSTILETGITSSVPGSPTTVKSDEAVAKLGTDMVDNISEHPLHNGLLLEDSSFLNGPCKVKVSIEGNGIAGSSQEDNSKEVFLSELETTQVVVVHSEEFTSIKCVTVSDYSSVTSTSSDFLAADHKRVFGTFCPNALSIGEIGSVGGSLEAISNDKNLISVDNLPIKRKAPGEVERLLAKVLVPAKEVDFLSLKEVYKSNRVLSRVEDPTLELNSDANGFLPSYSKKRKVASPRSNLSSFLEDEMVPDGHKDACPKLCQVSARPAEWEARKRDDSDKSLPKAASDNSQINAKISRSLYGASEVLKKLNPVQGNQTMSKNRLISGSPKVFPGHHPLYFGNSNKPQATNAVKSRTWHRTGNSSAAVTETKLPASPLSPQSHGIKTSQTFRSSYVRKGNSLVRNPYPPAVKSGFHNSSGFVYRANPGSGNLKTNQASDTHASSPHVTELVNTSETPCKAMDASEERIKSPVVVSQCRADSGNIATSQSTLEEGNSEKKIFYVKRRSNQLVASSNSDDMLVSGLDKRLASSSDGYYKSNKNQLVRALSENPVKKRDANGNSRLLVPHTILPRTCTKRPSKFSFVWKLHGIHSSEKEKASVRPQKVLPHVVPWKRTPYRRSFMHALGTKPNKSSFSIASQSLLLSRKRGAIYTRSIHGYSLKISKILSVGGKSLKWSKSIERNLKKADEEATRDVAAARERKKEENGAVKSRNNVSRKSVFCIKLYPGERIFRIGFEKYKMDPSRRTLHRVTGEQEPLSSVVVQSEKNVKRSYVPRRLLIGNEEYVQIGSGNQLVRDPKKRTRVLASEKVRWSLRTARLRLARKRKYCQFFTRFGKCNKDDGKCPYTHDASKIAVCTKFLNGLCTNIDCKLTHKVIPERMEDCSYFLKGSCSNEKCPYRHVNVNSESVVCKNFLRGYCADGNECLKKHSYICPSFEAIGSCPKASTCKLHHPKKKIEKKQPSVEPKIVKGRYFDGGLIGDVDVSDTSKKVVSAKGNGDVRDGKFPDYISLDVSDEEDSDDMVSDDFDVLV
ncbi:hypothetical protein CASFOL_016180 [Castilleja foliolosa]|uniref:C3H1-type domain-containing protein n=1 Tax=Castilleja foliolosa TaxID=1961234 RepID=A0ABD3DHS1_9LAMI